MENKELKGRMIEDVPYSGLVESLAKITLICLTADEVKGDLSKDDLMGFLSQIAAIGTEATAYAGATREEVAEVTKYLLEGINVGRERSN